MTKKTKKVATKKTVKKVQPVKELKLDFGCGNHKREGFTGVDIMKFPAVDIVLDLGSQKWPWKDNSVDEAHASHFVEHLKPMERVHFINELYRVLKPDAKCMMITPAWSSSRAYGDLTHQWPPVVEFWFFYLKEEWRKVNAPHNDFYKCNFDVTYSYAVHSDLNSRNQEYQMFALTFYKEAAQDLIATLIKK